MYNLSFVVHPGTFHAELKAFSCTISKLCTLGGSKELMQNACDVCDILETVKLLLPC
jgi:hypothetical protein